VLRSGRRVRARLFDVKRLDTPVGHVRLAIVVPKFGFTAVRRNQLKRRLKELSRALILPQAQSCDLLVRARRDAYAATFDELRDDVHAFVTHLS
jgi:ribonuclease P protein component